MSRRVAIHGVGRDPTPGELDVESAPLGQWLRRVLRGAPLALVRVRRARLRGPCPHCGAPQEIIVEPLPRLPFAETCRGCRQSIVVWEDEPGRG